MTTFVLARRFLAEYARNEVNLLLLILVPVVFVGVAADSLANVAEVLGGSSGPAVETVTAGWAAGFLTGIAMYFQISASGTADRRLILSGLRAGRLVTARLVTGLALAFVVSVTSLLTLWLRSGIAAPGRVAAGTVMFAVIYLAIGATVGALMRNPVNGTVLILFIWIVDIFFGPAFGAQDRLVTRLLPTHFVSLWMADLPLRHGGRVGDLGIALLWVVGAVFAAFSVVARVSRVRGRRRWGARSGAAGDQVGAALRAGWREWRRNPVLWALLAVVPAVFVLLADATTPSRLSPVVIREGGRATTLMVNVQDIHAGLMAPIAVASLATLVGLFTMLDTATGDRRVVVAGMRPGALLAARFATIAAAAAVATSVTLAVAATAFSPKSWVVFASANILVALTYALVGVLIAPVFGRVAGVFVAFLIPFLDVGIAQSAMLREQPATWAQFLPGYGSGQILIDGTLTAAFDEVRPLVIGLGWLLVLTVATTALFRRSLPRFAIPTHGHEPAM